MPNFVYYATFDESVAIVRDLCADGLRVLAPPGPLEEPKARSFSTVTDELVAILKESPSYYHAGAFTRFPVQFNVVPSGPAAGKYTISVLVAGPLMQSFVGRVRTVDGAPKLLPGSISYQKLYQNPETEEWEKPSAELLAAFRKAVSTIKKHCKPAKDMAGKFIAPEALKLLQSGEAGF